MLNWELQCSTWRRLHWDLDVSFEVACCSMQRGKINSCKEQDMLLPSLGGGPSQLLLPYWQSPDSLPCNLHVYGSQQP